ncbi:Tol biopolymer transport system component [Armatimonas rosea]|uniref:Tol biopolymer transport system component n=1 Tax=Armatimonas rosea TaxID=685828 RepID=A0A7W9W3N7_ARMRO|nr:Tol biopolymer transport system component [Armatimonas rosea]
MKKYYLLTAITLLGGTFLFPAKARTPQIGKPRIPLLTDTSYVAYIRLDSVEPRIGAIKTDRSEERDLWGKRTNIGSTRYGLTFTSEGRTVFYSNTTGIYRLDRDGAPRRILDFTASQLQLSPDGRSLLGIKARATSETTEIFTAAVDGTRVTILTPPGEFETAPCWSPDGTQVLYVKRGHIWLRKASGATLREIQTPDAPIGVRDTFFGVRWSPNGRSIVAGCIAGSGSYETRICVFNPDGTGFRILPTGLKYHSGMHWSPDNRKIVFCGGDSTDGSTKYDIFMMNADGSGLVNLTQSPTVSEVEPRWLATW